MSQPNCDFEATNSLDKNPIFHFTRINDSSIYLYEHKALGNLKNTNKLPEKVHEREYDG